MLAEIRSMKKQNAFTLIELIATLAVFMLLVTIGVPSLNNYSQSNRLITETNNLVGALNITRSEAIKRRTNISLCKSNDGATCNNGISWNDGWIIFVNTDNDSPAQVDGGEEILKIHGGAMGTNNLQASAALANSITYRANGFSSAQGSFIICNSHGAASAREIRISRTGRPSTSKGGGTCTP